MNVDLLRETERRRHSSLRNALGSVIGDALEDPNITEIMVNADEHLWYDTLSDGMVDTGERVAHEKTHHVLSVVAGILGLVVDSRQPILEAVIPFDGSRIEGVLPPVAEAPVLTIRKRAEKIYPLEDYLVLPERVEVLEPPAPPASGYAETLRWAVEQRKNILVVGGTNSAKTSMLNSLFQLILSLGSEDERLFVIEDTFELQCPARNRVNLQTTDTISLSQLVRVALRMRPDRIMIGEVRGAEALPMLRAWNTGHDGGLSTVHANSAKEALYRLEELVAEANVPPQPQFIARSVDLIVFLRRIGSRQRVVWEMLHVEGHDGRDYATTAVERGPNEIVPFESLTASPERRAPS